MLGYVTLGTNNLPRAAGFYDALFAVTGLKRVFESPRGVFWGTTMGAPMLGVMTPFDEKPANPGNGHMTALAVSNREHVDALYAKALELGGTCEGKPGLRMDNFYAAYFRDLDGNKLNCFFMG